MRPRSFAIAFALAGHATMARGQAARDPVAAFLVHGVSHELAVWRGRTIRNVRYELSLDVTALDSATGHVTARFARTGTADAIIDYRGRRVVRASVNGASLSASAFDGNHLRIPARLLAAENAIDIDFVSEISPSGASIIRAHDPDGSDYLYTLLVPADANQLFPCFDQPDLKARVSFTLTASKGWTVLANGSVVRADTAPGATHVVTHFAETRPLSTYLIAFAAGPWAHVSSTAGGRTIRAYVRRSRAREADTDTVLALTHRAIDWMERYFGRPYPFEKFDLLLAPAFPFGGMEHPGLVMFNEDRFIFRERPTLPRRLGRFSTVLHEVAHQWFGDLVTMKWFDDLWLKEGFATYMAAKALEDLEPAGGAWKTFYQGNKPAAYGVDQTAGTTPLWQAMTNLDQAKSAYGAIVYNKAPSVLKQLNYLVGEDAFRAGVQQFLSGHAYANATWQDLLGAVGAAWRKAPPGDAPGTQVPAKTASRSLDDFGRNFMLRAGMPEVEQRLRVGGGRIVKLELVQRPVKAMSGPAPWPMRTQVLLWYADKPPVAIPVELRTHVTAVAGVAGLLAPAFAFANYGDYGYFLTLLDSVSVRSLESGTIGRVDDGFLRTMLWGALWDQVRAAQISPVRFVQLLLAELPGERDEQIVPVLLGRLERSLRAYVPESERERLRHVTERVLWEGANNGSKPYGTRKAFLDAFVSLAASSDGVARLEVLLVADSAAGEPVRDPTRWEVVNRLVVLGAPGAERALAAQSASDTTPDGRRRTFTAGAARNSATSKFDYFKRYFEDKALNEDWASGSLGAFNAVEHQALTLPLLRQALDSLPFIQANRRIFFLGGWLGAFLNGQTSDEALTVVRRYLTEQPKLARDLRQKVLQNVDELERTVAIRKRWRD